MDAEGFAGFGSPVASPGCLNIATPDDLHGYSKQMMREDLNSPLLFRRTPGVNGTDSSKKFGDWVMSTSPYAGQKTPPTVSMKSMAAGDENTPPAQHPASMSEGPGTNQRFQAWLKATGSTSWTPKQETQATTPPRAPAPDPSGTLMSISHIPASAASPATEEPRSRPLFDLGASDTDSDGEEADTVIGVKQVAAAAARMRAALLSAGAGMNHAAAGAAADGSSMVPVPGLRAPAPSPVVSSPPPAAYSMPTPVDANSLATPMSQLSMSHSSSKFNKQTPTALWRSRMTPGSSDQAPASPVDKVIGLMMETGQEHDHHHPQHRTPSRFAGVSNIQPPSSPEQQVLQLMLQQHGGYGSQEGAETAVQAGRQTRAEQLASAASAAFGSPAEDDEQARSIGSESERHYSSSGTESDDEIGVAELQQLVGAGAGPGTPINDIISMMLTPELRATPSITPRGAQAAQQQPADEVGPRVLFADD